MLRIRLSTLLGERRLRISDVARDTGINRGTLTRLYYESTERIDIDTLDRLCGYLACDVGDLLRIDRTATSLSCGESAGSEPSGSSNLAGHLHPIAATLD
jgi:putative transcriptional regulator